MKPEVSDELREAITSQRKLMRSLAVELSEVKDAIRKILGPRRNNLPKAHREYPRYLKLRERRDALEPQVKEAQSALKTMIEPLQREESAEEYSLRKLNSGDVMELRGSPMRSKLSPQAIRVEPRDDT